MRLSIKEKKKKRKQLDEAKGRQTEKYPKGYIKSIKLKTGLKK